MNKVFMMEIEEKWIVVVELKGGRQQYVCESLEQAHHWVALLGAPVRSHHEHPNRWRPPEA